MFDNLGMAEFLTIAFFALLFFGPERLPRMGAKLGEWLAKLTQQSRLFMTQWREEALAVQEAVEEVRGIRDEIMAARNEIASSVNTAQQDINQSLDDAKKVVSSSQVTLADLAEQARQEKQQPAQVAAGTKAKQDGDRSAIEQTQKILAELALKLSPLPGAQPETPVSPTEAPSLLVQAPAVERVELSEAAKGETLPPVLEERPEKQVQDEWSKNYNLVQDMLKPRAQPEEARKEPVAGDETKEDALPKQEPSPSIQDKKAPEIRPAVSDQEVKQLNEQVSTLQNELRSLRRELEALRAEMLIKTALLPRTPRATEERV